MVSRFKPYQAENSFGDVSGKVVADLGCGCGTLGAAAALLGAEWVASFPCSCSSFPFGSPMVDPNHIISSKIESYQSVTGL